MVLRLNSLTCLFSNSLHLIWVSSSRLLCHLIHILETSLCGLLILSVSLHHCSNLCFPISDSFLQLLDFTVRNILQVFIAGIFSGLHVAGVIEVFDCSSLLGLRHTVSNKLDKFLCSCLGTTHTFFTFEKEDAILTYLGNALEEITFVVFAHMFIEPLLCVVFVKSSLAFFQALVGIDLVTECENDAQVRSIKPRKCILENSQTVDVCSIWSRALFENETG